MVFIEYAVPHAGEYVMVAENSSAPFSVIGPQRALAGGLKVFKLFSRAPLSNPTLGDIFQNLTVLTERCASSTFVPPFHQYMPSNPQIWCVAADSLRQPSSLPRLGTSSTM